MDQPRHLIEAQQFDQGFISHVFELADRMEQAPPPSLTGKLLATLFYEPSTRTRFSFEAAMLRLGGQVITTENAKEFSSAAKGETLQDTIRVMGGYVDGIVLRHFAEGAAAQASAVSQIPIINAGDGPGQHPTQALLDLYTIKRELGRIEGVTIAFIGDLKHGRTVRSLAYLLGKYADITIYFVSPPELAVSEDIKEYLRRHRVRFFETTDLSEVLSVADVFYQTRIQKERFSSPSEYEQCYGRHQLSLQEAHQMRSGAIIMHPLPRIGEIAEAVDVLPQARYFKQAHYGLYIRMALLHWALSGESEDVSVAT